MRISPPLLCVVKYLSQGPRSSAFVIGALSSVNGALNDLFYLHFTCAVKVGSDPFTMVIMLSKCYKTQH